MILTATEIATKGIVQGGGVNGRASTYDATVGAIIQSGRAVTTPTFTLPPRGIVWVVSKERFHLPEDITGLATLRTTWTHQGVLALNVGIIDPGWEGPLATALVNLSNSEFDISVGNPFFRVIFHHHQNTGAPTLHKTDEEYRKEITGHSKSYGKTFLAMDSLVSEVSDKVLGLPRVVYMLTIAAIIIALLAIFVPISFSVWTDYSAGKARIEALQREVDGLKSNRTDACRLAALEAQVSSLKDGRKPVAPPAIDCR